MVGPPIAIQPTAKIQETNYIRWTLLAAVAILIGVVGLLLFDLTQKDWPGAEPVYRAGAHLMTDDKATQPLGMAPDDDNVLRPEEPARSALTMQEPPPLPIALPEAASTSGRIRNLHHDAGRDAAE